MVVIVSVVLGIVLGVVGVLVVQHKLKAKSVSSASSVPPAAS